MYYYDWSLLAVDNKKGSDDMLISGLIVSCVLVVIMLSVSIWAIKGVKLPFDAEDILVLLLTIIPLLLCGWVMTVFICLLI